MLAFHPLGQPYRLEWYGRQLTSYSNGDVSATFTYDADGLRGSKTVNGEETTYFYVGDKLYYQHTANADGTTNYELYFYYDSYDNLSAIKYYLYSGTTANEYTYYVSTNASGDVLGLYGADGVLRVSYEYDTWGNVTSVSDADENEITNPNSIAHRNPIRYRGYYYDNDLGLYYLQSRYYDATIGRFINADGTLNGNCDIIGFNMFAYCSNNPVMYSDPSGCGKWQDFKNWVSGKLSEIKIKINRFFDKTHPYETVTEAAIASGTNLNEKTQRTNLEYGQGITYNPDTNSYGLTTTVTGEHASVDMSLILSDPSVVAIVHSHPNCNGHIGNEFSDTIDNDGIIFGDWVVAKGNQINSYLAAPDGNLYLMVWDAEEFNQSLVASGLPVDDTPVQCVF